MDGVGVRSCYDEGKRTAETLTMDYHRGANVEVGWKWESSYNMMRDAVNNVLTVWTWEDEFADLCTLQVRIARIFNTYGPRMSIDDGRVVSNFVAQVPTLTFHLFFFFMFSWYSWFHGGDRNYNFVIHGFFYWELNNSRRGFSFSEEDRNRDCYIFLRWSEFSLPGPEEGAIDSVRRRQTDQELSICLGFGECGRVTK